MSRTTHIQTPSALHPNLNIITTAHFYAHLVTRTHMIIFSKHFSLAWLRQSLTSHCLQTNSAIAAVDDMALDIFRKFFLKILLLSCAATVILHAHGTTHEILCVVRCCGKIVHAKPPQSQSCINVRAQMLIEIFSHESHSAAWAAHNNQDDDFDPEFLAPLENMTITQGRDVSFTCVVNELGNYKVSKRVLCDSCCIC